MKNIYNERTTAQTIEGRPQKARVFTKSGKPRVGNPAENSPKVGAGSSDTPRLRPNSANGKAGRHPNGAAGKEAGPQKALTGPAGKGWRNIWNALPEAAQSSLWTKAHASGVPLTEVMMESAADAIAARFTPTAPCSCPSDAGKLANTTPGGWSRIWESLPSALRAEITATAHQRGESARQVVADIATDPRAGGVADYKSSNGPGWKRVWKALPAENKKKVAASAAAWGLTVCEMMMLTLRAGVDGEPLIPAYAALERVDDDNRGVRKMKKELRARLLVAAEKTRMPAYELIRQGVLRICQEFEANGCIGFGLEHYAGLRLNAKNLRDIRWAANMMEVEPELFLNWVLEYECKGLRDRDSGLMSAWVNDLLIYDSPEEEARVKARWRKWLTRQTGQCAPANVLRPCAERKPCLSMKSGAPADSSEDYLSKRYKVIPPMEQLLTGWEWLCYSSHQWRRKMLAEYGEQVPESLRTIFKLAPVTNRKTLVTPPLVLPPAPAITNRRRCKP